MKEKYHKALIIAQTAIGAQMDQLGLAYSIVRDLFEIKGLSSIYLCSETARGGSNSGLLSVALVVETNLSPKALSAKLAEAGSRIPKSVAVELVAYDDKAVLTPELTLPHPELHVRPEWLIPSAEIWPEFSHPILSKSLQELVGAEDWGSWGSFHSQGDALLEFYYNRTK